MQKFTNGLGSTVLMLTQDELRTSEGQAAAVSSLNEGHGVTVQGLLAMKKLGDTVVMRANDLEKIVTKTPLEVVTAVLAYKTPERIFAYLGA